MEQLIEKAKAEMINSNYLSMIECKLNYYSSIIKKLYAFSSYKSYKDIKIKYIGSKLFVIFDFKYNVHIKFIEHIHTNNSADVFFEFLKDEDVKLERQAKNDVVKDELINREFNNVKSSTIIFNLTINEVDIIIRSDKQYETVLENNCDFQIYK
jgi:hypothetical protein